jgi:hypothetical protein
MEQTFKFVVKAVCLRACNVSTHSKIFPFERDLTSEVAVSGARN